MRQVVTYIRVSTASQGKSGLGIEAQRAALARFAEAEGCEVLAELVECETGKGADALDRRPQRLLAVFFKLTLLLFGGEQRHAHGEQSAYLRTQLMRDFDGLDGTGVQAQ